MKKKFLLYAMSLFYLLAGINHFRNPGGYYQIIPHYFGIDVAFINIASGAAEIILAGMLLFKVTRKPACYGIILLLIAFIPAHIQMIQTGFRVHDLFYLPQWAIWVRLIVFQPLLIWWAAKVNGEW